MNYIDDIFFCDKKRLNISRKRNRRTKSGPPPPTAKDFIRNDANRAPVGTNTKCVWKWNTANDCYDFDGCISSEIISQTLSPEVMHGFFEDIKKVEYYKHKALIEYIDKQACFWMCVFYIPFFVYSIIYVECYFEAKLEKLLERRRNDILNKMREFEYKVLRNLNPNLRLEISDRQGYITLIDQSPPSLVPAVVTKPETGMPPELIAQLQHDTNINNQMRDQEGFFIPPPQLQIPPPPQQQIPPPLQQQNSDALYQSLRNDPQQIPRPYQQNAEAFYPIQHADYPQQPPQQQRPVFQSPQPYNLPSNIVMGQPYNPMQNQAYGRPIQQQQSGEYSHPNISEIQRPQSFFENNNGNDFFKGGK